MLPVVLLSALAASCAVAATTPVPRHYDQLDDPTLTYYWYNGTQGAQVGEFIVKDGAQWRSMQTHHSGNVVTLNSKADYDALEEKPFTGLLAAPVGVNFDGLGIPYMEDFSSAEDFKAARDVQAQGGPHLKPELSCIIKFCANNRT